MTDRKSPRRAPAADETIRGAFPSTHWSILRAPGEGSPGTKDARRAWERLARLYWKPVYAVLRLRWKQSRAQAEDLTQDFFLEMMESPFLKRAEPGHGRFRNYVRAHLDHFALNSLRAERRQKRGGGKRVLSLDFGNDPDAGLPDPTSVAPDELLDRQWNRAVLDEAVRRLERHFRGAGQPKVFEVFRRYDLPDSPNAGLTHARLAEELGLNSTDVGNFLTRARRRLYELVREIVAESVDGTTGLRQELEAVFARPPS